MKKFSLYLFCAVAVVALFLLTSIEPLLIPLITFQASQPQPPDKPCTACCLKVN